MAHQDPIERFQRCFDDASRTQPFDASCAALATVSADGQPSVRFVLVKQFDQRGFVVYTNLESRKAQEIQGNPKGSLAFHWPTTGVQVRIEGAVSLVSASEADAYFASRPRGSQVGAWASEQSRCIADRETLEARVRELTARFEGKEVPRPESWGGYRIAPQEIEFWHNQDDRLHDRWRYQRAEEEWIVERLQP